MQKINGIDKIFKNMAERKLVARYGQQIGEVAPNGSRAFQRKVGDTIVTTGVTFDNKIISEITNSGNVTKKVSRNRHGDILEVSFSKKATDYRENVTENLKDGNVKAKVLSYGTSNDHPQYQVKTMEVVGGKIDVSTRNVKLNGKNYATEKV